jgi:hypothetical protein
MLGDFLKSVGGAFGFDSKPPVFTVPAAMPNFQARTGAELVSKAGLTVPSGAPDPATQSSAQFLSHRLNTEHDMLGATQGLAHGLPEKSGLRWAMDSAKLVENKLPPAQQQALAAAEAFHAWPCLATRADAALAAEKAGVNGPGGLAAKAASLASVPDGPPIPGGDKLLPVCVAGAVVTAAALSPPSVKTLPETLPLPKAGVASSELPPAPTLPVLPVPGSSAALKSVAAFKPFIDRGLELAAG